MKNSIVLIILFFAILYGFTRAFGPIPFSVNSVQTTKSNLFTVQGTGKATAIPNTAQISFGVTKQAATVADAQNQVNTATTNILEGIKRLGIASKDIVTDQYSVSPNYNFANGSQTPNGYTVTQTISVKISPIEKASQAIDVATKNGANMVGGVTFTFDDKTKQDLEDKARKMAVDEAKKKAQSLAGAAGMKLEKIVDVQEQQDTAPMPYRANGALAITADKAQAPTELPTGESSISTTITLSYETY